MLTINVSTPRMTVARSNAVSAVNVRHVYVTRAVYKLNLRNERPAAGDTTAYALCIVNSRTQKGCLSLTSDSLCTRWRLTHAMILWSECTSRKINHCSLPRRCCSSLQAATTDVNRYNTNAWILIKLHRTVNKFRKNTERSPEGPRSYFEAFDTLLQNWSCVPNWKSAIAKISSSIVL